jgi:predicted transcriptional regulator
MTLAQLVNALGLEVLTGDTNMEREIKAGYTSDLLSDAIANIEEDSVWITIQRHINILGVAKLKDAAAIIIPRNLQLDENVIEKAREEGIAMLRCPQSAFEISGILYNILIRG